MLAPGSKGLRTIAREELPPKVSGMMGVYDGNIRASQVLSKSKKVISDTFS